MTHKGSYAKNKKKTKKKQTNQRKDLRRDLRGVLANVLDYEVVVSEFELLSRYYFHFQGHLWWCNG